jgi:hypothetical protein
VTLGVGVGVAIGPPPRPAADGAGIDAALLAAPSGWNALGPPPTKVDHSPQLSVAITGTVTSPPATSWMTEKVLDTVPGSSVTVNGGLRTWPSISMAPLR